MELVLTGATGFVGSQVLRQLLDDDAVTRVTCLVRRPLSFTSDKLNVVRVDDFTRYDDGLLAALSKSAGCIWTLGGKDSDVEDPVEYERITHGFTLAFASGIAAQAAGPFTFCYVSGMGAAQHGRVALPWKRLTRQLKGRTERDLLALMNVHARFAAHCFRPGGVLPVDVSTVIQRLAAPVSVRVDDLATALIAVAKDVEVTGGVVANSEIKQLARIPGKQ